MPKLSIIVPVYYNAESLDRLYNSFMEEIIPNIDDYEIIMVDDGSGDNSWEKLNELAAKNDKIKIARLSRNFGSHAAVMAGFSLATGDCVVSKAADLQEPASLIVDMYKSWKCGNKVVLGVRKARQEKKSKQAAANMYYWLVRKFALSNMPPKGFDICLMDRSVLEVLQLMDEKNSAITLQVLWTGFKHDIVEYVRLERKEGKSRWTLKKKIKLSIDSLIGFSYVPIRFMEFTGVAFFVTAIIWALYVLISKLAGKIVVMGWSSMMILILFSFGLIMVTLGVLGEYIWRIFDASRNRPLYIFDEVKGKGEDKDGSK